jgi:hypothetical protein
VIIYSLVFADCVCCCAGEMAGAGRCRGLWLVKKRDKDLVGRLITSFARCHCPPKRHVAALTQFVGLPLRLLLVNLFFERCWLILL